MIINHDNKCLLVSVPKDAKDIVITDNLLVFSSTISDPCNCGGDIIGLPENTYSAFFFALEATEDEAKKYVSYDIDAMEDYVIGYDDYTEPYIEDNCLLSSATASLASLCRANGMEIEECLIVPILK